MKAKPRVRDEKTGKYVKSGRGTNIGVRLPDNLLIALQNYATSYFYDEKKGKGNINQAAQRLIYEALCNLGFDVNGENIPVPEEPAEVTRLYAQQASRSPSITGDGNAQLSASPLNANATDNAMSATQIGSANRNVNLKKNHDKPVPPSKRRK